MVSSSSADLADGKRGFRLWLLVLPWIALSLGCGGDDAFRLGYDQRIRGEVLIPPEYTGSIQVEAVNFAEEDPFVRVRADIGDDGGFELFVPDGEYRVAVRTGGGTNAFYGNGRARALEAQATPVSAGRGLETPLVTLSLGMAIIDVVLPGPESEWSINGYLLNPVLGTQLGRGAEEVVRPNTVRFTFPPMAMDEYRLQLSLWRRSDDASDLAVVPVEIDGQITSTVAIPDAEVIRGRVVLPQGARVRGTFVGPSASRPGAKLYVFLWDGENESAYVRSASADLSVTNEFEVEVFFERKMHLQWEVNVPGDDNDQTVRWLDAWTRGPSTPVYPSSDPEPIRLESIGIQVDLVKPDVPGLHAGWLEMQDESGTTRGAYYTDDRNEYQGPVFFSNLPPGLYYLHYRPNPNAPALDQWYATDLAQSLGEAAAIDARTAGTLAEVEWTPRVGGSISGTATLQDGSVAANSPVVLSRNSSESYEVPTRTDENGGFLISGLQNGLYRIGIQRRDTSQVTWYPNASDLASSEPIEITDYGALEGYDIQLLPLGGRPGPRTAR